MIEPELAREAGPLLSTAIASLVEDEHLAMVSVPPRGSEAARAGRLAALGRDVTALAVALEVILRRSAEVGGGAER